MTNLEDKGSPSNPLKRIENVLGKYTAEAIADRFIIITKNNSDELSEAISMAKNNEGDSHVDYTDQKTFINMKSEDLRAIAGFLSDMQSTIKYTSKVSDRKISLADSAKKIAKTIASQHNAS